MVISSVINYINRRIRLRFVNSSFPRYHLEILETLNRQFSLKGKTIIDIGGSNIPTGVMKLFGVRKFVCIDPVTKWGYFIEDNKCFDKKIVKINDFKVAFNQEYSFIVDDNAENINSDFYGIFDLAISISTFEHVKSVQKTINNIYSILKDNGILHAQYEPIYSCSSGHHVYVDGKYNFNNMPEISYMHLLYNQKGAKNIVKKFSRFDASIIKKIIDNAYQSDFINRFLLNEHITSIYNSYFNKYNLEYFYIEPVPNKILSILNKKYGKMRYDVRGIKITCYKI